MKKTIVKTLIATTVVAFTGCGVDGGGGGGSSSNLDINLERGVRLVKETRKDLKYNSISTTTYEYDELNRLLTMTIGGSEVSRYSYDGESQQESKIETRLKGKLIYSINSEYYDTNTNIKRVKQMLIRSYVGSYPSTSTINFSDYKGVIAQKRIDTDISTAGKIKSTNISKVSNDKVMKENTMTIDANENVIDEIDTTFSYDKLNRRISQKTTSGSKENIYLTNYSENKKTAKPYCYRGSNELIKAVFKKYPRKIRLCYLVKSEQYINNGSEEVVTYEYKINDKNLVTEERLSTGVVITYEYEEYESN